MFFSQVLLLCVLLYHAVSQVPSAYDQCDPFGEIEYGYNTCESYFGRFEASNCNYNLEAHNVCSGKNFDYGGQYTQIRDLCPEQCADVPYEDDSLDDTVLSDLFTGESIASNRRLLKAEEYPQFTRNESVSRRRLYDHNDQFYNSRLQRFDYPVCATLFEHHDGQGRWWTMYSELCCSFFGCSSRSDCRKSRWVDDENVLSLVSSISVGPSCKVKLYSGTKETVRQNRQDYHRDAYWSHWLYDNSDRSELMNQNVVYPLDGSFQSGWCRCESWVNGAGPGIKKWQGEYVEDGNEEHPYFPGHPRTVYPYFIMPNVIQGYSGAPHNRPWHYREEEQALATNARLRKENKALLDTLNELEN